MASAAVVIRKGDSNASKRVLEKLMKPSEPNGQPSSGTGNQETPHMGKLLSLKTGEVRIGSEHDFSRRSGGESLLDSSWPNENAERPTDVELMEAE